MIAQLQVALLETVRAVSVVLVILVATAVGVHLWRASVHKLRQRALARAENLPRERQLKIQTLAAVSQASGSVALVFVAGLTALSQFLDITPVLAGAGVVGLAVGLGAQSLIRDVLAGFFILLENHFSVGDVIRVNDQYSGLVEHLDLRRTVLRNQEGSVITIPNGEIRVVANLTREWSRAVVDIGVPYQEEIDRVMEVLERAGEELMAQPETAPLLLERPEILGVEALTESQVTIRVLLKTQPTKQWQVGRHYRALVKRVFQREGIDAPVPRRVVIAGSSGDPSPARREDA